MAKLTRKEVARLGASARWQTRHAIIKELTKYADSKQELDQLMKQKTFVLEWILKTIQYVKTK